jgi:hypothetical protein
MAKRGEDDNPSPKTPNPKSPSLRGELEVL